MNLALKLEFDEKRKKYSNQDAQLWYNLILRLNHLGGGENPLLWQKYNLGFMTLALQLEFDVK